MAGVEGPLLSFVHASVCTNECSERVHVGCLLCTRRRPREGGKNYVYTASRKSGPIDVTRLVTTYIATGLWSLGWHHRKERGAQVEMTQEAVFGVWSFEG